VNQQEGTPFVCSGSPTETLQVLAEKAFATA